MRSDHPGNGRNRSQARGRSEQTGADFGVTLDADSRDALDRRCTLN
jgi:hypothetical protein